MAWPHSPPESAARRYRRTRELIARVSDVDGRQISDFLLGHAQAHLGFEFDHGADRDRHFLATPQVTLLE